MAEQIVNKVAASGLVTLDFEEMIHDEEIVVIDIAIQLENGLVLREKPFREWLANTSWDHCRNQFVAVHCSADAIVPKWAFMLVVAALKDIAHCVFHTSASDVFESALLKKIELMDATDYIDMRVIVKGCGNRSLSESPYVAISQKLMPVVKSLMFGEPCSTVPVYKKA
jgi:hypothetical protein